MPEQVTGESELVTCSAEEVSEAFEVTSIQEVTFIQAPEEPKVSEVTDVTIIQDLTIIQLSEEPEVSEVTEVPGTEAVNEVSESATQAPEAVSEIPEAIALSNEAVSVASGKVEAPEVVTQVPEEVEAAAVTDTTDVQASEEPGVFEVADVTLIEEVTVIQASEEPEVFEVIVQMPAVIEISERTDVQAPEVLEETAIAEVVSQAAQEVVVTDVNTTLPAPEAVAEVPDVTIIQEVTIIQLSEEPEVSEVTEVLGTEAVKEGSESGTQAPETVSEIPEAIALTNEAVSVASGKAQAPERVTQTPEETAVTDATDVQAPEFSEEAAVSGVITDTLEVVTEAPEVTTQAPEEAEVSEVIAQTQSPVSEVSEIISEKYIALMAHDSKKSDLAQFVAQHKEFLSKCLTIATPSISETLYQQTSVAISQKTPSVPVGGYQTIASLVGSGDMLAVIFLRDVLVPQPGQANEEALLRLCNINQILLATNVPTAEAIIHYIKDSAKLT